MWRGAQTAKSLNDSPYSFRLKDDLETRDDRQLALEELHALTGHPVDFEEDDTVCATLSECDIEILRRRLAFWKTLEPGSEATKNGSSKFVTQSQLLEQTARLKVRLRDNQSTELPISDECKPDKEYLLDVVTPSPSTRKKNEYLSHPFHKYKAKFFPRLARSLINVVCPNSDDVVLDPFCGSGTACVEAGLMGIRSIGFDIDPLSVFISRIKANIEQLDLSAIIAAYSRLSLPGRDGDQFNFWQKAPRTAFKLPLFLCARRPQRFPPRLMEEVEEQITSYKLWIDAIDDVKVRGLFRLILSHAISTKISLRWMGTGDDRFALEIASRPLNRIFLSHAAVVIGKIAIYKRLRRQNVLSKPAPSEVSISDAAALPLKDAVVDGIVTSPPYLPAASGRETYLRSRASSIMALGLMSEEEILQTERRVLGSILAQIDPKTAVVPPDVVELANWMRPQRERTAKADPTIAYFENLKGCLHEMKRVLKAGGKVALVVSKEHTFWKFTTRDVLRKFNMARVVAELATDVKYGVGFDHLRTIHLELPKMDFVARPGAKGAYSEAIIILQKSS